ATISGIKEMHSEATADAARIFLRFDWGIPLDMVRVEVVEKIEMIRKDLPNDINHIYVLNFNATDLPVVQARVSAPGIDLAANYDLLEKRVKIPIQRIPGVARVELNGVLPKVVYIDLILDKLTEHGVNVGKLVESLSQNNVNVSLGVIRNDQIVMRARALGVFPNLSALMDFPVNSHGLKLRDIAEVRYEEPPLDFGRHLNHQNAVALEVYKEPTANAVEVATQVTRLITEHLSKDPYLQGIQLFVWQDQAREIRSGLKGIATSGLWGGLLAVLLLYLFLRRVDMTLIVSLAIPFSLLCGIMALYYLGYTLNAMSMMGLMLAVGLLVDNAIVVLESIDATFRHGASRTEAADQGTRRVELAVIASTTTTIIVFLPLIFGKKTQITTFLEEIGIAISLTLLASLLISLTLIPLATSRLLPERPAEPVGWIRLIQDFYVRCLRWTLRHRRWMLGITGLTLVSLAFPPLLGLQTSPFAGTQNRRQFLRYEFADFTYKADVEAVVTQVEQFLERQRDRWP
ncbi:MAG: efflux RND transporter permease subunit, partial [Acidobacteria bacterium]|nr:efflux RND transporter permease subunit [Acidobacteriota bacterium]